jgi:hypothetical protein
MVEHDGRPSALPDQPQPPVTRSHEEPPSLPEPRAQTWWKFWRRSSPWWREHHKLTAYATLLLALSTSALATFSLIQIWDFRDQESRQLRAYITSNGGGATLGIEPTTKKMLMHGNVRLHNSGGTPAYHLTVRIAQK